jgi:hypothetical protein
MNSKSSHRNVMPATACAASSTTTSQTQNATWGKGIRFYVTAAAVTAGGGADAISLCAVPPAGGSAIPIVGFSGVNMLSAVGVYVADFYPGAWIPASVASGGKLLGAAGVELPMKWAVQIVMGAGNAATITVDAEMMP